MILKILIIMIILQQINQLKIKIHQKLKIAMKILQKNQLIKLTYLSEIFYF